MTDVQPRFKEPREDKHPRGCSCKPCVGRRNRRKGKEKQNVVRKALGVPKPRNAAALTHEESWRYCFAVEVKAGAQVKPVATKFLAIEKQVEQNRAVGDTRPPLAVCMPDGWGSDGLVVLRLSTWSQHVAPLLEP